jgi:Fe-Mn family superoxide dismutase
MSNRREFLATGAAALATGAVLIKGSAANAASPNILADLPYAHDALEPHIDKQTMMIHHGKHHAAYVKNLIAALEKHPDLASKAAAELLKNTAALPDDIRQTVINNGGGHVNHTLFWEIMGPGKGGPPRGEIADAINGAFGDFEKFQSAFADAAMKRFGSGWAWLAKDKEGRLQLYSTANQDSPIMQGHKPILGIDVWEHAYYLKYQNLRADYVKAWWNVVNWDKVNELLRG